MKRFTLFALIAIMVMASMNVEAKRQRVAKLTSIPHEKLVTMIAKGTHWNEKNVARLGLKRLVKKIEREEYEDLFDFATK